MASSYRAYLVLDRLSSVSKSYHQLDCKVNLAWKEESTCPCRAFMKMTSMLIWWKALKSAEYLSGRKIFWTKGSSSGEQVRHTNRPPGLVVWGLSLGRLSPQLQSGTCVLSWRPTTNKRTESHHIRWTSQISESVQVELYALWLEEVPEDEAPGNSLRV